MINHVRTLLLNKSAFDSAKESSSEFVDVNFKPSILTESLQGLLNVLLPNTFNMYQLNYTLAYIMRILHTPDLEPYTLMYDPRYTYSLNNDFFAKLKQKSLNVNGSKFEDFKLIVNYNTNRLNSDLLYPLKWELTNILSSKVVNGLRIDTFDPETIQVLRTDFNGDIKESYIKTNFRNTTSQNIFLTDFISVYFKSEANSLPDRKVKFKIEFTPPPNVLVSDVIIQFIEEVKKIGIVNLLNTGWDGYGEQRNELINIWRHTKEYNILFGVAVLALSLRLEQLRLKIPILTRDSTLRRYDTNRGELLR